MPDADLAVRACGTVYGSHFGLKLSAMAVRGVVLDALQEKSCVDHLMQEGGLQITGGPELQAANKSVAATIVHGCRTATAPKAGILKMLQG